MTQKRKRSGKLDEIEPVLPLDLDLRSLDVISDGLSGRFKCPDLTGFPVKTLVRSRWDISRCAASTTGPTDLALRICCWRVSEPVLPVSSPDLPVSNPVFDASVFANFPADETAMFWVVFLLLSKRPFLELSTFDALVVFCVALGADCVVIRVAFDAAAGGFLSIERLFFRWILTFSGIGGGSVGLDLSFNLHWKKWKNNFRFNRKLFLLPKCFSTFVSNKTTSVFLLS